jgi:hypothetical protein
MTGVVTVAGALDYEMATSHQITARADSADGSFSTQVYNITVSNVNEAPAVAPGQTFGIAQNAANGDHVGSANSPGMLAATDPENGALQNWQIVSGNGSGAFQINATTGQVTVANASLLNYAQTPSYTLGVRVGDGVNASAAQTVTIRVLSPNLTVNRFTDLPDAAALGDGVVDVDLLLRAIRSVFAPPLRKPTLLARM